MAAIYDEIELTWGGENYTIQPSYRMIQSIESQGISIVGVSQRLIQGEPPISLVAQIVSHMLRSAGAKNATPDAVYEHLMTEADSDEIAFICEAVVSAFTPRKKDQEGNEDAPRTAKKKRSSKK